MWHPCNRASRTKAGRNPFPTSGTAPRAAPVRPRPPTPRRAAPRPPRPARPPPRGPPLPGARQTPPSARSGPRPGAVAVRRGWFSALASVPCRPDGCVPRACFLRVCVLSWELSMQEGQLQLERAPVLTKQRQACLESSIAPPLAPTSSWRLSSSWRLASMRLTSCRCATNSSALPGGLATASVSARTSDTNARAAARASSGSSACTSPMQRRGDGTSAAARRDCSIWSTPRQWVAGRAWISESCAL